MRAATVDPAPLDAAMLADLLAQLQDEGDAWWAEYGAGVLAEPVDDPFAPDPVALSSPVSPDLVATLMAQEPADVTDAALVDGVTAWQRVISYATAQMLRQSAELYARRVTPAVRRLDAAVASGDRKAIRIAQSDADLADSAIGDELGLELSWSRARAERLVHTGNLLTSTLVRTFDALQCGDLEPLKATTIASELAGIDDAELQRAVEKRILPKAREKNVPGLREAIVDAVLRAAPEVAAAKAKKAKADRHVRFGPARGKPDMCELWALLPADDAARMEAALTAGAKAAKGPGDGRSMDERRVDVMIDAVMSGVYGPSDPAPTRPAENDAAENDAAENDAAENDAAEPDRARATRSPRPTRPGPRAEVIVTVPLEVLTGASAAPGYLSRYGPVTADLAREMAWQVAADGTWRCAIVDDVHGTLLGLGVSTFTPTYRPPDALVRYVVTRDQVCSFVGCRQPAARCEIDHRTPWPAGPTCECNTDCDCKHHHLLKHRTGFRVRLSENAADPVGTQIWTTPTGRDFPSRPTVLRRPEPDDPPF